MKMPSASASDEIGLSRMPQRQRGRDRVAGLLAAAAALFVEKGHDATTMTEIAGRAGASIGSLYLFFPTKLALLQTMMSDLADQLSARLDALQTRVRGETAAAIADALFSELSEFLAVHPVYGVLMEPRGDDAWRLAVRARRRTQIAALFSLAMPPLPDGQPERLAMIVPELMRINVVLSSQPALPIGESVVVELRAMLRHHLEWPA